MDGHRLKGVEQGLFGLTGESSGLIVKGLIAAHLHLVIVEFVVHIWHNFFIKPSFPNGWWLGCAILCLVLASKGLRLSDTSFRPGSDAGS